jgi:hypothetical protein
VLRERANPGVELRLSKPFRKGGVGRLVVGAGGNEQGLTRREQLERGRDVPQAACERLGIVVVAQSHAERVAERQILG